MKAGNTENQNIYMTGCCLIPKTEREGYRLPHVLDLLSSIVLTAMFASGLLGMFIRAYEVETDLWSIFIACAVFSCIFCAYYKYEGFRKFKIRFLVFMGLLSGCTIFFFIKKYIIVNGFKMIVNDMIVRINSIYATRIGQLNTGYGRRIYVFALLAFLITWICASAIVDKRDNLRLMAIMFPTTIISVITGQVKPVFAAMLGFVFFVATVNAGIRRRKSFWKRGGDKAYADNVGIDSRLRFKLVLLCIPAVLAGILLSDRMILPALNKPFELMSDKTYDIRVEGIRFVAEYIPKATGENINLSVDGIGGGITGGILGELEGTFYTLKESIKITCDELPRDTIYLRGYTGTHYTGDRWLVREKDEYEYIAQHWKTEGEPWHYVYNLSFLRTAYALSVMGKENGGIVDPRQITIENMNDNIAYTYVPYNAFLNDFYEIRGGDCYVNGQTRYDNSFAFYESQDSRSIIEDYHDHIEKNDTLSTLDELEMSYRYFLLNNDAKGDSSERIKEICADKKDEWNKKITDSMTDKQKWDLEREKAEDVTNFIRKVLWERCEFEDKAVKLPEGKDFVDYFLFEKNVGDSTAFASAAVLMYRELGIPARYVEGYVAPVNIFTESTGAYYAVLQDDNAHAWAEIYIPFTGWQPVEVTPGFDGIVSVTEMDDNEDKKEENGKEEEKEDQDDEENELTLYTKTMIASLSIIVICLFVLLRYFILYGYRHALWIKKDDLRIKRIFMSFYEMLIFDGFDKEIDTTGEDFKAELITDYDCILKDQADAFMDIVLRTHYGAGDPPEKGAEYTLMIYRKLSRSVYKKLGAWGKLKFKLWKAF